MLQKHTRKKRFQFKPFAFAFVVFGVVFATVFSPVFSSFAEAQLSAIPRGVNPLIDVISIGYGYGIDWVIDKIADGILEAIKFVNLMLTWLIGIAAQFMNAAITTSLAGLSGIPMIQIGWTITRDIANIFFIFILLIIAIATILRVEPYGAKQLLAKLIIVALLVNFSLIIAFAVVDGANILALTFMERLHQDCGQTKCDVSVHMVRILNLSQIGANEATPKNGEPVAFDDSISAGWNEALSKYNQTPSGLDGNKFTRQALGSANNSLDPRVLQFLIHVTILILFLTTVFIFVAIAILLIIRSVALMVIFILAPFGFLFYILPVTRSYSMQWWQALFRWSFFFPISAFFIYLAVQYGTHIKQIMPVQGSHTLNTALLFNYFVVIALLVASLMVARQMSIYGSSALIGFGSGMARRARGYIKPGLRAGLGGAASVTGIRAAGRKIGDAAGSALEGELGKMPILRGGLSRIASKRQKAVEEEAKRYSHLSPKAIANMSRGPTGMSNAAAAQLFGKMKPEDQRKFADTLGDTFGSFAKTANQFGIKKSTLAKASGDIHEAIRILHSDEYEDMARPPAPTDSRYAAYQKRVDDYLDDLTTKEIGNLSDSTVENSESLRDYMFRSSKNLTEMFQKREHIQAFSTNVRGYMYEKGMTSVEDLAREAERVNHMGLAQELRTNIGVNLVLNPENIGVKTRRGIVRQVTAEE